jgi:glycolate oxidase FAD binding subunit
VTVPAERSLVAFAEEIGADGPVAVAGGRTKWGWGGLPADGTRLVRAPVGVVAHQPAEMTVRVGAGTTLAELDDALARNGQTTVLDGPPHATVGGVLATAADGIRRLRVGPVRDALLEARYVSAEGRLITAGGPTVKNVTGYDLCRLLVGSLGTLGLLGEVVLRTRPRPAAARWLSGEVDPDELRRLLYRPSCVLWDGTTTWVLLEGHDVDVDAQAAVARGAGLADASGPPELPPHRWSVAPGAVREARPREGRCVAEIGVGALHCDVAAPPREVDERVRTLHERLKAAFDPTGRCNPGRDPLRRGVVTVA